MRASRRKVPRFGSEAEEREFWLEHDSADYFDLSQAVPAVFPELRPTTQAISLRLPRALLCQLKVLANKRDVPYQSLIKILLAEKLAEET